MGTGGHTEEVVEEFTDVFVGLESIINGWLEFSIHVPEVELGLALAHSNLGRISSPLGRESKRLGLHISSAQ
jgi:hypothetical protein